MLGLLLGWPFLNFLDPPLPIPQINQKASSTSSHRKLSKLAITIKGKRSTDRLTDKRPYRQADRSSDRPPDDRLTCRQTDRQTEEKTDGRTGRQTEEKTDRRTDWQTDRRIALISRRLKVRLVCHINYSLPLSLISISKMLHISFIDNFQEEEMSKNNALVQQHTQQEIDMKKQVKLLPSDKFADITWAGNSQIIDSYLFFSLF